MYLNFFPNPRNLSSYLYVLIFTPDFRFCLEIDDSTLKFIKHIFPPLNPTTKVSLYYVQQQFRISVPTGTPAILTAFLVDLTPTE